MYFLGPTFDNVINLVEEFDSLVEAKLMIFREATGNQCMYTLSSVYITRIFIFTHGSDFFNCLILYLQCILPNEMPVAMLKETLNCC